MDEQTKTDAESTETTPAASNAEVQPGNNADGADTKKDEPISYKLTDADIQLNPHLRNIGMVEGAEVKVQFVQPVRMTLADGSVINGLLADDFVGSRPGKGRNG